MFCHACEWFCVLGTNLLCSRWEYTVTFACYRGNGCHWPGCRARGSIPSQLEPSKGQWRGHSGFNPSFQSGSPPHGYFQCLLCASVHSFSLCLCHYSFRAEHKQACQVGWAVSPWPTSGSWYKHHLLSAWSTDYFICVTLQGSTEAHELGFLLFTDWFWHFSGVVTNLWLRLREQGCFLIHWWDLHHPVSCEAGFYFWSHLCPSTSIAQNVFPLPIAAGSPHNPSAANICQGAGFIALGHYRQTLVLACCPLPVTL